MKEKLTEENIKDLVEYRLNRAEETIQEAVDMLEKDHFNVALIDYIMLVIMQYQLFW